MPAEHPQAQWNKVAAELRAARAEQQRTWGDIDNAALGRYLADEASSSERIEIETALQTLPELKLLTDLVRDVLTDTEVAPLPSVARHSSPVLPFQRPAPFAQKSRWDSSRQRVAVLAAACLFLALGAGMFRPDQRETPAPVEIAFAKLDVLQRQIAADEKNGDLQNALAAANAYSAVAANSDLENNRSFAPKIAEGWNQVGLLYTKEGDIDRAERALAKANDINRKTLGENHEVTRQTCFHLASVYQDAVARRSDNDASMAAMMDRPGTLALAGNIPMSNDKAGKPWRDTSLAELRKRMKSTEMQNQVRNSVLPVLVKALQDAPSAPERARLAGALGNLGSLAQDASPVLVNCLKQAKEPYERYALVRALNQMGPPSDGAVPVLVRTLKQCETQEVRQSVANYLAQAPAGKAQLDELAAHGKAEEQKSAREALKRPRGGR